MNFKGVKLKVIFLIHFVMISWSTLGQWSHNVGFVDVPVMDSFRS